MNIGELAKRGDVTSRTIRYYVEQGLLPPPERGYPAEYTDEHVERLELIRLLKDERLPLEEIRTTVQQLSGAEVRDLLQQARERQSERDAEPPPGDSAADYITRVLQNSSDRDQSLDMLNKKRANTQAPLPPPYPSIAPGAPPPAVPMPMPVPTPLAREEAAADSPEADADTWRRVRLTPDVEIHYQVTASDEQRSLVDRLVEQAARILGRKPEKG